MSPGESMGAWAPPRARSLFYPQSAVVALVMLEGMKSEITASSHFPFCRHWHHNTSKNLLNSPNLHEHFQTGIIIIFFHTYIFSHMWTCTLPVLVISNMAQPSEGLIFPLWQDAVSVLKKHQIHYTVLISELALLEHTPQSNISRKYICVHTHLKDSIYCYEICMATSGKALIIHPAVARRWWEDKWTADSLACEQFRCKLRCVRFFYRWEAADMQVHYRQLYLGWF